MPLWNVFLPAEMETRSAAEIRKTSYDLKVNRKRICPIFKPPIFCSIPFSLSFRFTTPSSPFLTLLLIFIILHLHQSYFLFSPLFFQPIVLFKQLFKVMIFHARFFVCFFFQASAKALSRKKGKKGGKRRRNKGNIKERKKSKPAEGKKKGN